MRPRIRRRSVVALVACALTLLASACGGRGKDDPTAPATAGEKPEPAALRDEIPPDRMEAVLAAHYRGLGLMEQYKYGEAAEEFRKVHELAPGWIAGSINLAIALLNRTGEYAEASKKKAGASGDAPAVPSNFDEALKLLEEVLRRDPKNLHAHYCRGVVLEYLGNQANVAYEDFKLVTELDPSDGHAWYHLAGNYPDPENPSFAAGYKRPKEMIEAAQKALECNPYLIQAWYKLSEGYRFSRDIKQMQKVRELWAKLNPQNNVAGPGDSAATVYGEMGRYAKVIGPPLPRATPGEAGPPPRFEAPTGLGVALPSGHRWVREADFTGPLAVVGRVRARFGAAVAAFDADRDGKLDLFLAAAAVGPKGVHDLLLRNKGDGRFEDATAAFGLPDDHASLGAAAGDFDADGHLDLFLTGVGDNRLLRNVEGKRFEDITKSSGVAGTGALSLTARWLDLDQDGDLDLYVVNYTSAEHADEAFTDRIPPALANAAYRNDGKPVPIAGRPENSLAPVAVSTEKDEANKGLSIALTPWTGEEAAALGGGETPHVAVAALDVDDDRDLDLIVAGEGGTFFLVQNDRLGRFRGRGLDDLKSDHPVSGLLVTDFDRDGRPDLVATRPGARVALWHNARPSGAGAGGLGRPGFAFDFWATNAHSWRGASAADLDLDGWPDLLGLPVADEAETPHWARNEGNRFEASAMALAPVEKAPIQGLAYADLAGDPLPDLLLVRDGEGPRLARNLGNGNHWLSLDLSGRWKLGPDGGPMRTNPQGLGARIALEGIGLNVPHDHTTPEAGLAQSSGPVVLGMGRIATAPLVHVRWPDGVIQCELNQKADVALALAERCRKTGSCPVLFAWDGERFVCLGDFLGGGGLGYLVAPGVYGQPDRDEAVAIAPNQLREVGGVYRLAVSEPMDELAYLDQLTLQVVDRPPGVSATPDERFAPGGNRPTGELIAWKTEITPTRATDLAGRDVTEALRAWDRVTVDGFRRLGAWTGYAEEHGIVLDFGDRLAKFEPTDRLVLALAGWVEYPYSQTNYAASTAGVALRPPVLERQKDDGTWEVIEPDPGYPAGLPRRTTLDLTGKLTGPRCVLRLRTNMECYWDQAFIAVREPNAGLRVTLLSATKAELGYRGYTREVSPDGRQPLLYDYRYVDPAPLAHLAGRLTRYGDVAPLLARDDDQFCLVGPGDEVRLEFDARSAPALPEGWTRSYVFRAVGYCKDADPFTATSDTVEPLPWKGMPTYPFGPESRRREDPAYRTYLRDYQTREVGR
jgi:tetratricopeptide (TPR) repeat protein